ncbi:hypothetical protein SNEBB_004990 [Seison nebaliae]|nr:hypothetical protein SNEBB_004990 [Seison nebaliae]
MKIFLYPFSFILLTFVSTVYSDCLVDDMKYSEGDVIAEDKCQKCYCYKDEMTCVKTFCGETKCPDGLIPVVQDGECCPICTDHKDSESCTYEDQIIISGKKSLIGCNICSCENGLVSCVPKCALVQCTEGFVEMKTPDGCCTTCEPDPMFHKCWLNGTYYEPGQTSIQHCMPCSCDERKWSCATTCPEVNGDCKNGESLGKKEGECCERCMKKPETCAQMTCEDGRICVETNSVGFCYEYHTRGSRCRRSCGVSCNKIERCTGTSCRNVYYCPVD